MWIHFHELSTLIAAFHASLVSRDNMSKKRVHISTITSSGPEIP